MTVDTELELWKKEWREDTQPLPELKKKIRKQNVRTVLAVAAICLCLTISMILALRTSSIFMYGLSSGIAFAGLMAGGYGLWARRGAWKPVAQTTQAYAELAYKRSVARARTVRFMFYLLLATAVLFAGFLAWNFHHFHARDGIILAALIAELFYLKHVEKRKKLEIEETRKLVSDLNE